MVLACTGEYSRAMSLWVIALSEPWEIGCSCRLDNPGYWLGVGILSGNGMQVLFGELSMFFI